MAYECQVTISSSAVVISHIHDVEKRTQTQKSVTLHDCTYAGTKVTQWVQTANLEDGWQGECVWTETPLGCWGIISGLLAHVIIHY